MKGRQTVDMEAVDSTANAQYRVNCCGLGSKEGEVVGDVGEAFSLSLSDWDRRRSAEPRRIAITPPLWCSIQSIMDETTSATWTTRQLIQTFCYMILSEPALRHIRQVKMVAKIQTGQQKSKIR